MEDESILAFQTDLNGVEAARAGDQGKGFAVVATGVRNVAGRSAEAARQIRELIQDSVEKVQAGASLVNHSGKTLERIVTKVDQVGMIVAQIAEASVEDASGIDQVNQAIASVDQPIRQHAAAD